MNEEMNNSSLPDCMAALIIVNKWNNNGNVLLIILLLFVFTHNQELITLTVNSLFYDICITCAAHNPIVGIAFQNCFRKLF